MHKEMPWDMAPMPEEAAMAQLAYNRWERAEAENLAQYVSRRRTVDLALLVRQVIDEELTPVERQTICLRYDEQMLPVEIAALLHLNKASVSRALQRGEERIRQYLKYVLRYQYNLRHVPFLPLAVRQALVVSGMRRARVFTSGARLRALRKSENLTVEDAAEGCGIQSARLRALEQEAAPDAQELLRLSAFYGVCADSILKGEAPCKH
ncbi:MAG: transcriptional regulator [Clostridia bacterium]|nr:transcriptional regulator [Clostridia bacterium]